VHVKKVHCTLQADHEDAAHTFCHFFLSINTDHICSISESMIKHEPDKKSITCTRILSLHGGHKKLTYHRAAMARHDAQDICSHFLLAYRADLIYSISKSMRTHEMYKKSIICTRISSLCGDHQNSRLYKP
jgi:hypothetical protein